MATKKKPSAKQLAARRKFAKIMKSGGFKKKRKSAPGPAKKRSKSAPKRRKSTSIRRKAPKRKAVAGKKRTTSKKSFTSKIPLVNNPTFKKAAQGVGMASLGVAALSLVAPQFAQNPIVKPALALLGGDVVGLAAQLFTQGGLGSLRNLTGGNGNGAPAAGAGFA